MKRIILLLVMWLLASVGAHITAQPRTSGWLEKLLRTHASDSLLFILDHPDTFHYQLIYTQINRDKNNLPAFRHFFLNVDDTLYFNPASTVKLPTALMTLEKLNTLAINGLDKNTPMYTDSAWSGQHTYWRDTTSANGLPSIGHYLKKIFLVSDNDAYNRLYEFVGQQPLNQGLWKKGYTNTRITRRFTPLTTEETRQTNPIRFVDNGQTIYEQPMTYSTVVFDFSTPHFAGLAHRNSQDSLIQEPMDFTTHNVFVLRDMQGMLQAVIFPNSVPVQKRFRLSEEDYQLLYQYMSEFPRESAWPHYDSTEFFDSYAKFFFDSRREHIPPYLRLFNKTGWSYGFLTDICYLADFEHAAECMLTATIYANSDGIINDDHYDYETWGRLFFREIGKILYQYELSRPKTYHPDLSRFKVNYR